MKRPLCLTCGQRIRKRTIAYWFGANRTRGAAGDSIREITAKPTTLDEAQRLVGNLQIVLVRWYRPPKEPSETDRIIADFRGEDFIRSAHVWDGESFEDPYFCTKSCAAEYGHAAALGKPQRFEHCK